jgi:hypothetical protein
VPDLLDQLRDQRAAVRTTQDGILTRAGTEQRDLTPEELAEHTARSVEARELDDRIEQLLADQAPSSAPHRSGPRGPTSPGRRF